ncbi:MAG: Eco57I restriction-modification methylase domain-containing protein [Kiritimatiellae bacterium]|nr:Eco57I restriction-modification methylase domain-containing protein [Kiritimatiellia bacterium]
MTLHQPDIPTLKRQTFVETFKYKLIYVYTIDDRKHEGYLKVGDTDVVSSLAPDQLAPNCKALNDAARARIDQQTQTAGVEYQLLYTELAVRYRSLGDGTKMLEHFTDKKVHAVLKNSGLPHKFIGTTKGREWFGADLKTVKAAIAAVKDCRSVIAGGELEPEDPIEFREEQVAAVEKTLTCFKKKGEMLWDAKMRFGKTLTALQVVREAKGKFRRVIIVTHRPVVGSGWQEDFNKLFTKVDGYTFYRKSSLGGGAYEFNDKVEARNDRELASLDESGKRFIYFASIQDLRGSQIVNGKYDKNRGVFTMDWDLVIVDEAHEGTQTDLGKEVREHLVKKHTKVLSLSGTPFNILSQYDEDSVFVWDYVMEQKRKETWDEEHPDEPNPYAALPRLNLYTYDLGAELDGFSEDDLEGKAFNFREFFRTWTGNKEIDHHPVPRDAKVGDFVHEDDVRRFLDLISGDSPKSRYPFATQEHRDLFRHTLWMVPGVASAKALSALLRKHRYFKEYGIANVAGEGDDYEERHYDSALELVKKTIRENEYSITLSCGKLTTGVTVPEWTAVLMVAGSAVTSAAQYMQTIFRVQSPGDLGGKMKTDCYAFDFAPDRALKVLAETAQVSCRVSKNDTTESNGRRILGEFLNYCPVISISGTKMEAHDVKKMMASIKHIFVMKTIRNGFDDTSLYSNRLLELTDIDLKKFEDLRKIVGSSKQTKMADTVYVNEQDFAEEEHAKGEGSAPSRPLSEEERAAREEMKRRRAEKKNAILILRAISIRMPLLIYGADVPIEKVISIKEFPTLVDDESWAEFMPQGVTKTIFKKFVEYYDADVFAEAGTQIRKLAKSADKLPPTRRVQQIARIFGYFKNPDKETVLTPWRVVNMHLADTIGGWCFYDESYEKPIDEPRLVGSRVSRDRPPLFSIPDAKILEVNSKSGLYPLYVAYSLYRRKLGDVPEDAVTPAALAKLWREVVARSLFVVCKTPMARAITRRTLVGYDDKATVNAQYIKNLVELLKNEPKKFYNKVCGGNAWNNKEFEMKMLKFDAVVGNPPYQQITGGGSEKAVAATQATPIFNLFVEGAKSIAPRFISMIIPARWYSGGMGLNNFRYEMLHDKRITKLFDFADSRECFSAADIAGGLCYFLWDSNANGPCLVTNVAGTERIQVTRELDGFGEIFIRNNKAFTIIQKVRERANAFLDAFVSGIDVFGFPSKMRGVSTPFKDSVALVHSQGVGYVKRSDVKKGVDLIDKYKVTIGILVPCNGEVGVDPSKGFRCITIPRILKPNEVTTFSYLVLGAFKTQTEAENFKSYMLCKFSRFMLRQTFSSMHIAKQNFILVPAMDFKKKWTDELLYEYFALNRDERKLIDATIRTLDL